MTYIPRPLDNSVTSTQTIRDGAELINNNFEELAETISALEDLESDVSDIEGILSDDTNAASRKVATNAQALAGTAGVLPDAAGVHAAFKQFGLGASTIPNISNADNLTTTGFYSVGSTWTGSPFPAGTGTNQGFIVSQRWSSSIVSYQTFFSVSATGRALFRINSGSGWSPWRELHHTGNGATNAEALAGTNNEKWMSPQRVHEAFKQFGLGVSPNPDIGYDFDSALGFSGTVSPTLGGNAVNSPYNSWGGIFTYKNGQSSQAGQIYLSNAPNSGATEPRAHIRTRPASGTVTGWRELYHTGNILGTVSQSGGVPTGAIIQRGSNANGEWVRFADGTQICTSNVISDHNTPIGLSGPSIFFSSSLSWIFPIGFVSEPRVNFSTRYISGPFGVWAQTLVSATSSVTGVFLSNTSRSASGHNLVAIAIGRWY